MDNPGLICYNYGEVQGQSLINKGLSLGWNFMKHLIHAVFALSPLAVLADPGHGAPVVHTHWWEVIGWVVVVGAVGWIAVQFFRAKNNRS